MCRRTLLETTLGPQALERPLLRAIASIAEVISWLDIFSRPQCSHLCNGPRAFLLKTRSTQQDTHIDHLPPPPGTVSLPAAACPGSASQNESLLQVSQPSLGPPIPRGFRNPSIKFPTFSELPECARMSEQGPEFAHFPT